MRNSNEMRRKRNMSQAEKQNETQKNKTKQG